MEKLLIVIVSIAVIIGLTAFGIEVRLGLLC